jgi:phospholipase/carboxylesterase
MLVHRPMDDDELNTILGIVAASHAYASGTAASVR